MTEEQAKLPLQAAETEVDVQKNTTDLIEQARQIAERVENANREAKTIVERHEAMMAKALLGGRSEAGQRMKTQAELDEEEAKQVARRLFGGV